jgi:serine/threonine-protein kinase
MSPEQFKGYEATEQSDIYAFGAVLFESIVGTVPYAMPTEASIINAHLSEPVPKITDHRPELPTGVDDVIARAMAKEPEERYNTATAMMEELAATLAADAPVASTLVSDVPVPPQADATRIVTAPEPEPPPPAPETRVATAADHTTLTPEEHVAPEEPITAATVAASAAAPLTTVAVPPAPSSEPRHVEETTISDGAGAAPAGRRGSGASARSRSSASPLRASSAGATRRRRSRRPSSTRASAT